MDQPVKQGLLESFSELSVVWALSFHLRTAKINRDVTAV